MRNENLAITVTTSLSLTFTTKTGSTARAVPVDRAIIAGWTGRDRDAMEAHIAELEDLGVKRPARTPMFYRVAASRITTSGRIEVIGGASSGEAEFVLLNVDGTIWVGVGSDHTDREAETIGVTLSKQMCDKPIAAEVWPLDEVSAHWDRLVLRAHATIDGQRQLYQEGPVSAMLDPRDLIDRFNGENPDAGHKAGDVIMGGTLPALGGVRPARRFEVELDDPVLGRSLSCGYDIEELPILG